MGFLQECKEEGEEGGGRNCQRWYGQLGWRRDTKWEEGLKKLRKGEDEGMK